MDSRSLALLAGAFAVLIALGMRHSFGLFLAPVTTDLQDVGRGAFGLAIALQNLFWGLGQPFAGMLADKFGSAKIITLGAILYASGLLLASVSTHPLQLHLGLGLLVGCGLS